MQLDDEEDEAGDGGQEDLDEAAGLHDHKEADEEEAAKLRHIGHGEREKLRRDEKEYRKEKEKHEKAARLRRSGHGERGGV